MFEETTMIDYVYKTKIVALSAFTKSMEENEEYAAIMSRRMNLLPIKMQKKSP